MPNDVQTKRAVLYTRISLGDKRQSNAMQLSRLRDWAAERDWQIIAEVSDNITGDPDRRRGEPPGLQSALRLIGEGKANVLVVFALDRIVRSPQHLIELVRRVEGKGGRVASYLDGDTIDAGSDIGELILFIRGRVARMERKLTSRRTQEGMAAAKARGARLGRPKVALPDRADVERLRAEGLSFLDIAHQLNTNSWRVRRALGYQPPYERRPSTVV
jgi:DNA invertase Pin-like site-specific DNA recombinase